MPVTGFVEAALISRQKKFADAWKHYRDLLMGKCKPKHVDEICDLSDTLKIDPADMEKHQQAVNTYLGWFEVVKKGAGLRQAMWDAEQVEKKHQEETARIVAERQEAFGKVWMVRAELKNRYDAAMDLVKEMDGLRNQYPDVLAGLPAPKPADVDAPQSDVFAPIK